MAQELSDFVIQAFDFALLRFNRFGPIGPGPNLNASVYMLAIAPDSDMDMVKVRVPDLIIPSVTPPGTRDLILSAGNPLAKQFAVPPSLEGLIQILTSDTTGRSPLGVVGTYFTFGAVAGEPELRLLAFLTPPTVSFAGHRTRKVTTARFTLAAVATPQIMIRRAFWGRSRFHFSATTGPTFVNPVTLTFIGHRFDVGVFPYDITLGTAVLAAAGAEVEFAFETKFYDAIEVLATGDITGGDIVLFTVEVAD